jgi:hypothetical protein
LNPVSIIVHVTLLTGPSLIEAHQCSACKTN